MNKKLVKTRIARTNTIEAMACTCVCGCYNCLTCSGGGSFQATEKTGRQDANIHTGTIVRKHDGKP